MVDLFSGSKPGRPTLLVVLSAGCLVGTLGLAWLQARDRRALDEPRPLLGMPLTVRPPRGWVASRDDPATFVPYAEYARGVPSVLGRRVIVQYARHEGYVRPNLGDERVTPARIGALPAVQARIVQQVRVGRTFFRRETVLRTACSPRGDEITVAYSPSTQFMEADRLLLDAICDGLQLTGGDWHTGDAQDLQRVGVQFLVAADWEVFAPPNPEEPGVYLISSDRGVPSWALGILRTWSTETRTPKDLLTSFARQHWRINRAAPPIQQSSRRDGSSIASISDMRSLTARGGLNTMPAAIVISSPTGQAAMITVFADIGQQAVAEAAANALADELTFTSDDALPDVPAAMQAGRSLAARFAQHGARPWWGDDPPRASYIAEFAGVPSAVVLDERQPAQGGYEGRSGFLVQQQGTYALESWRLDRNGGGYESELRSSGDRRSRRNQTVIHEQRRAGEMTVTRTIERGRLRRNADFSVSDLFVCPPLEAIAEFLVATGAVESCLIEVSTRTGVASHTRLLRGLSPDENGRARVLLLDDFWPRGEVLTFDEDGQKHAVEFPLGSARRLAPDEEREYPLFKNLRALLE